MKTRIIKTCRDCGKKFARRFSEDQLDRNGEHNAKLRCSKCLAIYQRNKRGYGPDELVKIHKANMPAARFLTPDEIDQVRNVYQPPLGRKTPDYHLACGP